MNFTLTSATIEHKKVIENLMQFYIYNFSEFLKYDVSENGMFEAYPGLDAYWNEEPNRFPYIIKNEEKYIGFVLVKFIESGERHYFSIAEFFILKKYRLEGIGKAVAKQVFNLHKGQWEVYQKESNKPAQLFWNRVINEYTKGNFKTRLEHGRCMQDFES